MSSAPSAPASPWTARFAALSWRLTLYYTLALVLILAVLGVVLDFQLRSFATQQLEARLMARTVVSRGQGFVPGGSPGPPPESPANTLLTLALGAAQTDAGDVGTMVFDAAGRLVSPPSAPPGWRALPTYSPALLGQATTTSSPSGPATVALDGARFVVFYRPITEPPSDATIGVLQVSAPVSALDSVVRTFRLALAAGIVLITTAALVFGRQLASLALLPLRRFGTRVAEVDASNLTEPMPVPPADDEIRDLAIAFNHMLGRISASVELERRTQEQLRRFVADASHELRSPLTALSGYVDLLVDRGDLADARRVAPSMRRTADRMNRLVQDLFVLTRLDAAIEPSAAYEPIDLAAAATDVVEGIASSAGSRHIKLEIPADAAVWTTGDSHALERVVENLVRNAIQHTPDDGCITVSVGTLGGQARLTVADDGEGIAPEHLPRVFERFYRADAARARDNGNAGLGLAIVSAIVSQHRGQVSVQSQPGHGATFTVTLPAAET